MNRSIGCPVIVAWRYCVEFIFDFWRDVLAVLSGELDLRDTILGGINLLTIILYPCLWFCELLRSPGEDLKSN